ncbi:MAG: phospholipid carrier-dependent glycosyltransferase [Patescibacteria group bacterium]
MLKKIYNATPIIILIAILATAFSLMWGAAKSDSVIMDELAHIPAGFTYVKMLDYRLNPEHPPLVKALSALPLLALDLKLPTEDRSWKTDINSQWDFGAKFLYDAGNDALKVVKFARFFPIILTLLTIILIYIWSRELLGNFWALLPTVLFSFSPTVLAHGHYVTTDIGATFGVIFATYLFLKFLNHSTNRNLIFAGLGLGIAELMKFSNALLIPFFVILALIYAGTNSLGGKQWRFYFRSLILIFLIGSALIYTVYFVLIFNEPTTKQLSDATIILTSFTPRFLANIDLWLIASKIFRPFGEYLLGLLMVLERSAGGNTSYFLGEVSNTGSRGYFPLVFLMKESLPTLILILIGAFFAVKNVFRKIKNPFKDIQEKTKTFLDYLGTHYPEFSMLLFVIIYWAYSMKSPLNIGIRHLLPTFPFIYILTASALKNWFQGEAHDSTGIFRKFFTMIGEIAKKSIKICLIFGFLLWLIIETVITYPYFLSYFNEAAGGVWGGYHYVTDSNYDWGQDLGRLKQFVLENNIKKIAVDYFGGGNPKYYLGENVAENWSSAQGSPSTLRQNSGQASSGQVQKIEWLAVSVNILESAVGKIGGTVNRNPNDEYSWLKDLRPPTGGLGEIPAPDFRAGTSIFIYKL